MKTYKFETVPQFVARGGVIKILKPVYSITPCSIKKLADTKYRRRRMKRWLKSNHLILPLAA